MRQDIKRLAVRIVIAFLLSLLLPTQAALAQPVALPRVQPLIVVATTTHIADFARTVAGDRAIVTSILPTDADPHEYEPLPSDIAKVAGADVVLVHGLGLDAWLTRVTANAGGDRPTYVMTQGVPIRPGDEDSPDGDPHVWQNPQLVKIMVDNVATALSAVDPDGVDTYRSNASAYRNRLERLDRDLKATVEEIPRENRLMVTNHDAFHYYTEHYGLTFIGSVIPSTSTEAETSAGALGQLIRLMLDRHVNAIFTENTVDPRIAQNIADQTGAKVVSGLYSDSLGGPRSGAETYEAMMRRNTRIIADALK
jgi:zinc/manganese transport system substrate-binding protein